MSEREEAEATAPVEDPGTFRTNAERLREHLAEDGLSRSLLEAWTSTQPDNAHAKLLAAVEDFFKPKEPADDQGAAQ